MTDHHSEHLTAEDIAAIREEAILMFNLAWQSVQKWASKRGLT